jgi:hypothetical protein
VHCDFDEKPGGKSGRLGKDFWKTFFGIEQPRGMEESTAEESAVKRGERFHGLSFFWRTLTRFRTGIGGQRIEEPAGKILAAGSSEK